MGRNIINNLSMKRNKQELKLNLYALLAFSFIPTMELNGLWFILGDNVHEILMVMSALILTCYLIFTKKIQLRCIVFCFLGFQVFVLYFTMTTAGVSIGFYYFIWMTLCMFEIIIIDGEKIIDPLCKIFSFLIIAHAISIPLFSLASNKGRDMQDLVGLIGGKNHLAELLIPMAMLNCANSLRINGKLRRNDYFILIVGLASVVEGFSTTGWLASIVTIILLFYMPSLVRNFRRFLIIYGIVDTALVMAPSVLINLKIVRYAFSLLGILDRVDTLNNRGYIWSYVVPQFLQHPLIGHGRMSVVNVMYPSGYMHPFTEVHNTLLEIFFMAGMIGGISYVMLVFFSTSNLTCRGKSDPRYYLIIGLVSMFICGMSESLPDNNMIYIMFLYAYTWTRKLSRQRSRYAIDNNDTGLQPCLYNKQPLSIVTPSDRS